MLKLKRDYTVQNITSTDDTFEIAFSSETPVEREITDQYGQPITVNEILVHDGPDNADLTRLNNDAALLFNHDFDKHLGKVISGSVRIDSDRIGRAQVQFSKYGELAQEIKAKVEEGTISKISFGYDLVEYQLEGNDLLVTKWAPYEISFVTVPADDKVGLGRLLNTDNKNEKIIFREKQNSNNKGNERMKRFDEMTATDIAEMTVEELVNMSIADVEELADEARAKREEMLAEDKTEAEQADVRATDAPTDDEPTEEQREQEAEEILEVAERYKVPQKDVAKAIAQGMSARQFKRSIKPNKAPAVIRKMTKDTKQNLEARFDLGAAFSALADGKSIRGAEAEYHQEAMRQLHKTGRSGSVAMSRGIQIPMSAFGARAMNNSASLDPIKQEVKMYDSFVEMLLADSVVSKLGINVKSGLTSEVAVPKQTASSVDSFGFIAEDGTSPEGESAFADIKLTPHTFSGGNPLTRHSMLTMPNISGYIADHIVKFGRIAIEQLMFGAKAGNANTPDSIIKQLTDLNAVEQMGMTYKDFLKFSARLRDLGVSQEEFKYLMSGAQCADLQSTLRDQNVSNYIVTDDYKLGGHDVVTSGVLKDAQSIAGDFSGITVAEWSGLSLDIDDTTYRSQGKIVPRIWCDLDWKVTGEDRLKLVTLKPEPVRASK